MRLLVKARHFLQHPAFAQAWFAPVWGLLGISRLVILTVHFRRLAPRLGANVGVEAWVPLVTAGQAQRARQIGRTVALAARHCPWEANCFAQAVAAHALLVLYRVPHVTCFGLAREAGSDAVQAHAWVGAGPVAVTGGAGFGTYTVVGAFVSAHRAAPADGRVTPVAQRAGSGLAAGRAR